MDNLEYLAKKGESSKKNKNLDSLYLFFTQEELDTLSKRSIAIVGTNGKTSTANYIFNYLEAHRISAVQFTSPHLKYVNERIMGSKWLDLDPIYSSWKKEEQLWDIEINGFAECIAESDLDKYLELVKYFERKERIVLGYFESLFLIACRYFLDRDGKWFIVEAGIGGRLDTTSIINSERVVLTNIGLDHTEVLGDSHIEILKEKIHISKRVKKFFVGGSEFTIDGDQPLFNKFIKDELNLDDEDYIDIQEMFDKNNVVLHEDGMSAGLKQVFRIQHDFREENHHLARAVFKDIYKLESIVPIPKLAYLDEYNDGRFQLLDQRISSVKVLDGAHNGEAIFAFFKTLDYALYINAPNYQAYLNACDNLQFECFVGIKKGKGYKAIVDALIGQPITLGHKPLNINISLIERDTFYEQMNPRIIGDYLTELGVEFKLATLDSFHYYSGPSILMGSLYLVGEYKLKYDNRHFQEGGLEDASDIFYD